jgi:hypothetical protein
LLALNLIKVRAEEDRKKELEKQIALKQQQKEAEKRKQELVMICIIFSNFFSCLT